MYPSEFVRYADAKKCPCCKGNNVSIAYPSSRHMGAPILFCRSCEGFPMYCGHRNVAYILHTGRYTDVIEMPCQVCGSATEMPHHMALLT